MQCPTVAQVATTGKAKFEMQSGDFNSVPNDSAHESLPT